MDTEERKQIDSMIDTLERMKILYQRMRNGGILPHTDEMKTVDRLARRLIRELVEEWV